MDRFIAAWKRTALRGCAVLGLGLAFALPAAAQRWEARVDLSEGDLVDMMASMQEDGMGLVNLSAYRNGEDLKFAALWWASATTVSVQGPQPVDEMADLVAAQKTASLVPKSFTAYTRGGETLVVGVWSPPREADEGDVEAFFDLGPAAFQQAFDRQVTAGRRPIRVQPYVDHDELRYLAVFASGMNRQWQLRHGMDPATYQRTFDDMVKQGYMPLQVAGASMNGKVTYAAIWQANPRKFGWEARHGQDQASFIADFKRFMDAGYSLLHLDAFDVNGKPRFASIWVKS